jgi:hypothetical protein
VIRSRYLLLTSELTTSNGNHLINFNVGPLFANFNSTLTFFIIFSEFQNDFGPHTNKIINFIKILTFRGRWCTYGQHFSIYNSMQSWKLKLKLYIVIKSWQKSLIFQLWQNIKKIVFVVSLPIYYSVHKCPENK